MEYQAVNLQEKFLKFSEKWSPKIIAQMNDYHIKLVRIEGDFVWHSHDETDEVFLVLDGTMQIYLRDGPVTLKAGEMFVVPRGIEHQPHAEKECQVMLVEPTGTVNTGKVGGERTAKSDAWI